MKKPIRKTVDNHLPKWLHSRFLTAIDYIWQAKSISEVSRRAEQVSNSGQFSNKEMEWVMALLIIPQIPRLIREHGLVENQLEPTHTTIAKAFKTIH